MFRRRLVLALAAAATVAVVAIVVAVLASGGHRRAPALADLMQTRTLAAAGRTVNAGRCPRGGDWAARAASCAFGLVTVSRDPLRNPSSQHEAAVEPSLARSGSSIVVAYQVARAVEGGAAAAIGFATTHDDGRHWQSGFLPRLTVWSQPSARFRWATDPAVAYDAAHRRWLVVSFVFGADDPPSAAIVVSGSRDGVTWSSPVRVVGAGLVPFFDKPWITCDDGAESAYRGTCYVLYSSSGGVFFQRSGDGGRTWSQPLRAAAADMIGALPVVAGGGEVEVFFRRGDGLFVTSSTDGGRSFRDMAQVARVRLIGDEQANRDVYPLRAPTLPSAAVDSSGTTYVVWPDCAGARGCTAADLFLSTSQDGRRWTRPVRAVRSRAGAYAVLAALGADAAQAAPSGRLALVYYLWSGRALEPRLAFSADGGATWSSARPLAPLPRRRLAVVGAPPAPFVGDYVGVAVDRGSVAAALTIAAPRHGRRLRQRIAVLLSAPTGSR